MAILCDSFESGRPDSAMVPSVCCSVRDETEMHLAHFPVHRILWWTGSDKGEELLDEKWCSALLEGQQLNPPFCLLPVQLSNFLNYLMDNFTPSSNESKMPILYFLPAFYYFFVCLFCFFLILLILLTSPPGNLISHIFRENEICRDAEWERYFCYKNIEVPEIYSGPHLTFPLTVEQAIGLVEAFRNKKVSTHHWRTLVAQRSQSITYKKYSKLMGQIHNNRVH